MNFVKGCTNDSCSMNGKSHKFKLSVNYCPECGTELVAVCKSKKCRTVLDNPEAVYCVSCRAKREDRKDKVKEGAAAVGGGAMLAGAAVVKNAGKIAKVATRILPK